ncbi:MAG TPA: biotin--[acetyl-CoA-carboxylase] ligase [Dehalococcoidales bacterium]|nr:biotin--[acetyl-CoA-carboxylase] ligase [Dehalococcoidales bacterium]
MVDIKPEIRYYNNCMREQVLKYLQQEKHVSGEELGKRLKISRTAVWKHVKELRKLGYQIESSTKSGYTFMQNPDLLLAEEIENGLITKVMGKNIRHFVQVSSTQDIASELAKKGLPEGTLVIAEMQTQGRGRKGREWISVPDGGLYFSLILRPKLLPSQVVQIPLIASVAVVKAIKNTVPLNPEIKWPNDIFVGDKKAGGILTEMSSEIDGVNYVILGVGLNVNIPASFLAEKTGGIATSLINEVGKPVSRTQIMRHFLVQFENIYNQFVTSGFSSVREEWKNLNNTIGAWVKISDGTREFEGEAVDIDERGFLLVRTDNSRIHQIVSGDVTLRIRADKH